MPSQYVAVPELAPPAINDDALAALVQPTLDVEGCAALRPWRTDDAASVVEAFQDPSIQRWHVRRADSVSEAEQWIDRWHEAWIARSDCTWAIVDRRSDELLGRIALKAIDKQDGVADLAYWMVPAARGRGICPNAMAAVSGWAFDCVGLTRLQLEHSTLNDASCRAAYKAGFIAEGIRRQSARHADGWHDMHVHSRLRDDPQPLQPQL